MNTAPFKTGKLPDGSAAEFYKTNGGRTIRIKKPGPPPHEGRMEVFEQEHGKPVCVCCVDSDTHTLNFFIQHIINAY